MPNIQEDFDVRDFMNRWESPEGVKDQDELLRGFQHLVSSGMIHRLNNTYQTVASMMIASGMIHNIPKEKLH